MTTDCQRGEGEAVASGLPKPYYEHAGITIYHGDCRDILPHLGTVDLVLTDPPYGIGIAANPIRQRFTKSDWDDLPCDDELLRMCLDAAKWHIVWGGNYFDVPVHKGFLVWDKVQPENFSTAMVEQAYTNFDKPAKLFRRHVVSYYREHPTEKPIELMRWCIEQAPERCEVILDPFMGSGTTLRAAKDLGRKAIGIEMEERYCEIAAKRLSQEVLDFA